MAVAILHYQGMVDLAMTVPYKPRQQLGRLLEVSEQHNFHDDVLEVLMAVAILHYQGMVDLAMTVPYVTRFRQPLHQLSIIETEAAAWSLTVRTDLVQCKTQPHSQPKLAKMSVAEVIAQQTQLVERQTKVIESLTEKMTSLNRRLLDLEHAGTTTSKAKERRSDPKSLTSVWYEWFTNLHLQQQKDRRRYHEAKVAIAFMRQSLPNGYDMSSEDAEIKARSRAEPGRFPEQPNTKAKAVGTVVKALKKLHARGELNEHTITYQRLQENNCIVDPSPRATIHELHPTPHSK
ncbi:hypothetical protein PHMEG_00026491 [Phytophthora megakarya]|uniref:Uncharacterized protein n=1 Tax=Phytophthora megakarya TaxID=4795 RepID=A0A225VAA2_9STRA|nr:hypothetical protein PHMEG_00026491 [Phytophthora megakarya]